ncbi:uncharacterized protein EDB93DRAFT_488815 [Suillus bovinus]|uniref:uncharacterized protein n=1 Tax=Suillus bovinus TaxID=48563 RepID=UPI001B86D096|nr:uncharacterized protein EDB93DRAFT_488815 [Suillus bovinus]KAG2146152.1 hypothetical protein EDB93DRAFT_488815 [Suillus bovinus]
MQKSYIFLLVVWQDVSIFQSLEDSNHIVSCIHDMFAECVKTAIEDTMRILQPVALEESLFTARSNSIIHTGIATIIVLEYSAFLLNNDSKKLESVKSAVHHYMKSPTAVAVEKGAKEISRSGYEKTKELEIKILDFILENRMSKDSAAKK